MARSRGFDADVIIHGIAESLLAPEISLSGLDAYVAEQKLNLFQFAARLVTQARAGSTEGVWGNAGHRAFRTRVPHHTPDDFRANPVAAIRPALFIARKIVPERRFAAVIHDCKPEATHAGIGIVRT
jgi:hypothetical protein